jgi:uncharacterized protein YndB with AHSA1/START domain
MDYNWETFTLKIDIESSKENIFRLLSTQEGLEAWFLRSAKAFRSGKLVDKKASIKQDDKYEWLWHGYPDEVLEKGAFLDVNQEKSISFTFTGGKTNDMYVEILISPYKNKFLVTLNQYSIPNDEEHKSLFHLGCSKGWTFYLTNLKSVAEHSYDLRNKDIELTNMVNA